MLIKGQKVSRETMESYRLRAIKLRYEMGYSVSKIAEIFGVHYQSASRWFCKERSDGIESLKMTKAKGAVTKIDEKTTKWLKKALVNPATKYGFAVPLWNSVMIRNLLKKEKSLSVDKVTIFRLLKKMGLTFQKPEKRYVQQNKRLVEKWMKKEWPKIKKWAEAKQALIYFEDESGISLSPVIGKTWARKGHPPVIRVTGKRGEVSAMSAISPSGKLRFRLEERRINSKIIIEFINQIIRSHPRRKVALIMDNAPCHKSKAVQEYFANNKKIRLFYLPPYSPELNPDEKVWRHLKHVKIKNHTAEDKKQLIRVVISALRSMQKNPALTKNFFKNYLT